MKLVVREIPWVTSCMAYSGTSSTYRQRIYNATQAPHVAIPRAALEHQTHKPPPFSQ